MSKLNNSDIANIVNIIELVKDLKGSTRDTNTITLKGSTINSIVETYEQCGALANKITGVLNNKLSVLDYENIKAIKTIMYLGKYEDYESTWEDIYAEYSKNLVHKLQGKELDIASITSEFNIDTYLERGLVILGVYKNI